MALKGIFTNTSPWVQLLLLIGAVIVGEIVGSMIALTAVATQDIIAGYDVNDLMARLMNHPPYLRFLQMCASIGRFILPALFCSYLFYNKPSYYLKINRSINPIALLFTILCAIAAIPIINYTNIINQQMTFPEWLSGVETWMKAAEEQASALTERMLYAENIGAFIMNLFVVAILAGIGEEFIFRGVGLNIFLRIFKNPHVAIWVIAFLFSAIHMQFYGFLPRFLMGAYLGYLMYYTRNIWYPVIAHTVNNAVSVVLFYIYQDRPQEMEQVDSIGWGETWWISLVSIALFTFFFIRIKYSSHSKVAPL